MNLRNIYDSRRIWKMGLIAVSLVMVACFIYISNNLVKDLAQQERDRMEIWANATKELASMADSPVDSLGNPLPVMQPDVDFLLSIIEGNHTIPVMLVDNDGNILQHRNFHLPEPEDNPLEISPANMAYLQDKLNSLKGSKNIIEISIDDHTTQHLYYEDSTLLRRLAYYPYIQLAVMLLFIAVAYFALISVKKAEQNKVWVGLSKETAHQLGTPISSLMAWSQYLEGKTFDSNYVTEVNKDLKRLETVAHRFSKIGSKPELKPEPVCATVQNVVNYLQTRSSRKVKFVMNFPDQDLQVPMNRYLFEWVIENICKNAIDAMDGKGTFTVIVSYDSHHVYLDLADTGKGMSKKIQKKVFESGFTTKQRGWGLGLSLAKRIINQYHRGRIFVKYSVEGQGTVFRIVLNRN